MSRMPYQGETYTVILLLGCIAGLVLPAISRAKQKHYNMTYSAAYSNATYHIGDMRPPLTMDEKRSWYQQMGVREDAKPTISQLKLYLEDIARAGIGTNSTATITNKL